MCKSCPTILLLAHSGLLWLLTCSQLQAADRSPATWLIVETPPAAQRLHDDLIRARQSQEWEPLLTLCQRTVQEYPAAMFEYAPGHFVDGRSMRSLTLTKLPPEGYQVYLENGQAESTGLLQAGQDLFASNEIPPPWHRLLDLHPGTLAASEVCRSVGDRSWHAGNILTAADWWLKGLASAKQSPLPASTRVQVDLLVRLGMASVLQSRFASAREIQLELQSMFPDVKVTLGGKTGPAAEVLEQVLQHPENQARQQAGQPHDLEPIQRVWQTDLQATVTMPTVAIDQFRPRSQPTCLPQFWQNKIIVSESQQVTILDAITGKPAWPTGLPDDDGLVYEPPVLASVMQQLNPPAFRPGCVAEDAWFGTTDYSPLQPGLSLSGYTRLIALDLQAEGRLQWAVDSRQDWARSSAASAGHQNWIYSSSPLAHLDEVIIVLRSFGAEQGIGILVLDRHSGELKSFFPLDGGAAIRSGPLPVDELLIARDQLFVLLNGEWLVALSIEQRAIRWLRRLDAEPASACRELLHPRLLHDSGMLYLAGCQSVLALDPETGDTIWQADNRSPVSGLIGIEDQLLLAVGTHAWGIHARTGKPMWRAGPDQESAPRFSPAVLARHTLLWGDSESILVLNPRNGTLLQRLPWEQLGIHQLQSLQIHENELFLAQPGSLTAIKVLWQTP